MKASMRSTVMMAQEGFRECLTHVSAPIIHFRQRYQECTSSQLYPNSYTVITIARVKQWSSSPLSQRQTPRTNSFYFYPNMLTML